MPRRGPDQGLARGAGEVVVAVAVAAEAHPVARAVVGAPHVDAAVLAGVVGEAVARPQLAVAGPLVAALGVARAGLRAAVLLLPRGQARAFARVLVAVSFVSFAGFVCL